MKDKTLNNLQTANGIKSDVMSRIEELLEKADTIKDNDKKGMEAHLFCKWDNEKEPIKKTLAYKR